MWSITYSRNDCSVSTSQGKNMQHHHGAVIKLGQKIQGIENHRIKTKNQFINIYIYVCVKNGNKGCVLGKSRFGCYCVFCYQIQSFSFDAWDLDLECYFSNTTELKHNLYQAVDLTMHIYIYSHLQAFQGVSYTPWMWCATSKPTTAI